MVYSIDGPFVDDKHDDLPFLDMVIFQFGTLNYQRVNLAKDVVKPTTGGMYHQISSTRMQIW